MNQWKKQQTLRLITLSRIVPYLQASSRIIIANRIKAPLEYTAKNGKTNKGIVTVQKNYLTAKEPEQRVAHIPPMEAPGPAPDSFYQIAECNPETWKMKFESQLNTMLKMLNDAATAKKLS